MTNAPFIYLDHNATTPVHPEVLETMLPYFSILYGNAASNTYGLGLRAKSAVDHAREIVAELLHVHPQEITFTSGATEALNTAIKGIFWRYAVKGKHFITLPTEHKAVLDTLKWLETQGAEVHYLQVDREGMIDLQELENQIRTDTIAVIAMLANNETGVIQPIARIAEIVHGKNSILICDATQAIGKIPVDIPSLGADVLVLSAHKFYGPKGIGALYLKRRNPRVSIEALIHGGGHERGNRSGTLNVPGIVGLGKAAALAPGFVKIYEEKISSVRDFLSTELTNAQLATINSLYAPRIPNTLNIKLTRIKAETVIKHLQDKVALATGSACSSADPKPSHVLMAMGLSTDEAHHTLRISLGIDNTMEEAEIFLNLLKNL